jgi:hypothetical protein
MKLTFDQALEAINEERSIDSENVNARALQRKVWVASNGSPGCLNDSTSVCLTKRDAIESCLLIAGDDAPRGFVSALQRFERTTIAGYIYRIEQMRLRDLF